MILGILLALLAAFSQFLVYKVGRPIKHEAHPNGEPTFRYPHDCPSWNAIRD